MPSKLQQVIEENKNTFPEELNIYIKSFSECWEKQEDDLTTELRAKRDAARRKDGRYYDKEKHTIAVRSTRRHRAAVL